MSAAVAHGAPDVSGVVDLDLLQGELDAARGQVEMWCAQRELSMKEAVAAHKTNMMESEEQYVRLVEKEKDIAASGEEAQRRKEYERGELEALRETGAVFEVECPPGLQEGDTMEVDVSDADPSPPVAPSSTASPPRPEPPPMSTSAAQSAGSPTLASPNLWTTT